MIETIYVEDTIQNHPKTKFILNKFKKSRIISINKYGEIFNKRNQNFRIQKANPCLILAHKKDNFVLPAPEGFGIGSSKNFYFSHMYNCIYDCRYCFLQGMYSSANYVIFVNFEDFDISIKKIIENNLDSKVTFFSGYDCDSLALENVTGFAKHNLSIFRKYPQIEIEFRTKSIQKEPFLSAKPMRNVILAYSLMPELMSNSLDNKAPSISKRIRVISELASKGWKIGLRFDPLIHGENWKELYQELAFENTYRYIDAQSSMKAACLEWIKIQNPKNAEELKVVKNMIQFRETVKITTDTGDQNTAFGKRYGCQELFLCFNG